MLKKTILFLLVVGSLSACEYLMPKKPLPSSNGDASAISTLPTEKEAVDEPSITTKSPSSKVEKPKKSAVAKPKVLEKTPAPMAKPIEKSATKPVKPTTTPKPAPVVPKSATPAVEKPTTNNPQPTTPVNVKKRNGKDDVFMKVEVNPTFGGGESALFAWLKKNIKYPSIAKENGTEGTVYVQFVVEKDGSIGETKVVKGVDSALDAEAVRVVSAMPRWSVGKQNGKAVAVQFTLPVRFELLK